MSREVDEVEARYLDLAGALLRGGGEVAGGLRAQQWRRRAACAGRMVPDPTLEQEVRKQEAAREYCAGCTVVAECARDALARPTLGVVRAGVFVPQDRKRYRSLVRPVLEEIAAGVDDGE